MSDRVTNIIILCEDREQQNLVRKYLLRLGYNERRIRAEPLPAGRQSGSQYVREQFPKQVVAFRARSAKASCLLIVMTDADDQTPVGREQTLHAELKRATHKAVAKAEQIVILIPKWQVETWIKCLLRQAMSEDDKTSDKPPVTAEQIKSATGILYDWARPNATIGETCVPSLRTALPQWLRIG